MVRTAQSVKPAELIGMDYRRWLATGEMPAHVSDPEPADADEVEYSRRASASPAAPMPDAGDSPERIRARRIAYDAGARHPGMFTDVVGAWFEGWPVANATLKESDDEPLGETEAEEHAAIMSEACRDRAVRKIWRLTGEWLSTENMSNEDIWDWFDMARYLVQCWRDAVAKDARKRRAVA